MSAAPGPGGHALLRRAGVALLVDLPADRPPVVLHWGGDLGPLAADDVAALRTAAVAPVPHSALDQPAWLTLLPGEADGWSGRPALRAHRGARRVTPRWLLEQADVREDADGTGGVELVLRCRDDRDDLLVSSTLRLEAAGLLRVRHVLTVAGPGAAPLGGPDAPSVGRPDAPPAGSPDAPPAGDPGAAPAEPLDVTGLEVLLPLPAQAGELLDLTGRWCRERSPQRRRFDHGCWLRASRRGRTGHDAPLLLLAGTPGFGFGHGEVHGVHVAWSGDHVHAAERLPEGAGQAAGVLAGGELLRGGEVRLAVGESYATPWVCFTTGDGLDAASARVHRWLRGRPGHPRSPRPLVLNTWEAVYFAHDLPRLRALADVAARVGVERFVLDDGWFRGRRHERAGLGDWTVDPQVWPDGLDPLVGHVRGLGMQVGLWVEPEMANLDSDLARSHPDWLLAPPGRLPPGWRYQHTLDLGRAEVREHLLHALDALVERYRIDYLKWDHNRDLHEAVHGADGSAGVHRQTAGVYALLDALRSRHPRLEVESCASGGARVDLEVLQHTDRVWASDTNDPVERQAIQRWTGLLLPPELVGSHVGPATAHTTGRRTSLAFRCLTALFGHAGLEWDLTACDAAEVDRLTAWAALYRETRPLLHGGDVVRSDHPDPATWVHGVRAPDGGELLLAVVQLATSAEAAPGRVRLPGTDPARRYRMRVRHEASSRPAGLAPPPWWDGIELPGAVLAGAGLQLPVLHPAEGVLLHLEAV